MKVYRVIFEYSRLIEADNDDHARKKAEYLRVAVGTYRLRDGEFDPEISVEIKDVVRAVS